MRTAQPSSTRIIGKAFITGGGTSGLMLLFMAGMGYGLTRLLYPTANTSVLSGSVAGVMGLAMGMLAIMGIICVTLLPLLGMFLLFITRHEKPQSTSR